MITLHTDLQPTETARLRRRYVVTAMIPYNEVCRSGNAIAYRGHGPHRYLFAPYAFGRTLDSEGSLRRVTALVEHNKARVIASVAEGTLQLAHSAACLLASIVLPTFGARAEIAESVSRGDLRGASPGYRWRKDRDMRLSRWPPTGEPIWIIERAELDEVSLVRDAAFARSRVEITNRHPRPPRRQYA